MKAAVQRCYGAPTIIAIENVAKPTITDRQILVRVRAAAINPLDWHFVRGTPYLLRLQAGVGRPTSPMIGVDFSGTVEAVGPAVTRFKVGDAVFGGRTGALAEYLAVSEEGSVVKKPDNVTFEQAAAVGVAAVTALQGLRDKGGIQAGSKVLINGASGGVGTYAVQIAKALGAEVTGVSSTRNLELVQSIGADHMVDYTKDDFTAGAARYDLILDNVTNHPLSELRRVLTPKGSVVIVGGGGPDAGNWVGPFASPIKAMLYSPFVSQRFTFFVAAMNQRDLTTLAELMAAGKVTPVIDRTYPLEQAAEALSYLETGRARGKVVIIIGPS